MKKELTLAFLGPEGTFSHLAAIKYQQNCASHNAPRSHINLQPFSTIAQLLYAVEQGVADLGIAPAENSVEGSVNVTTDLLAHELSLYIRKEIVLDIKHYLLTHMTRPDHIHTLMSHPQALAQCRHFLQRELKNARLIETTSTAEAVRRVCLESDGTAAIAPWECHLRYHVPVLFSDIGDYSHNQTRFLLVGKDPCPCPATTKTSLVLALEKDRPGGLYEVLGEFARHNINLSRIESRPAKKELGNYLFFIDCEAGGGHPGLLEIMHNLKRKTVFLKNLGSYSSLKK